MATEITKMINQAVDEHAESARAGGAAGADDGHAPPSTPPRGTPPRDSPPRRSP